MSQTEEANQESMFDLSSKEFNPYWIDENAKLIVPNQPLHWKAHKLQILIERLEKQAERNPAQFNSKNYIDALNEFEKLCTEINRKAQDESLDAERVVESGNEGATPEVGARNTPRLGLRISADNPIAG